MIHAPKVGAAARPPVGLPPEIDSTAGPSALLPSPACFRRALAHAEAASGNDGREVVHALTELGVTLEYRGGFEGAERHYVRALGIVCARLGPDTLEAATLHHNLGGIRHARGDCAGAEALRAAPWRSACAP